MTRPHEARVWSGPEICQDWHDARRLLAAAGGYDGLTLTEAVAVLLPTPTEVVDLAEVRSRRAHPSSRRPRLTVLDVLTPPPDVTEWTGEGWTERDESMRRHPSTRARALGGDR